MSGSLDFKKIGMFKKQVRGTYLLPAKSPFGNGIAKSFDKGASKFKIQYFRAVSGNIDTFYQNDGKLKPCCNLMPVYCRVLIQKLHLFFFTRRKAN